MKKVIYLASFFIVIFLLLSGCSKVEQTETGLKITEEKIITDDISYVDGDSEFIIHRNKVTRNASVSMKYKIKNEDEYGDFFGQRMTFSPFLINLTCAMFNAAIFNPEALKDINDSEDFQSDDKMNSYLEGYTKNKITIEFIDAEDGELIASCESTQAGNENIKFNVFRDYTDINSMFGAEIGKYEKVEENNNKFN